MKKQIEIPETPDTLIDVWPFVVHFLSVPLVIYLSLYRDTYMSDSSKAHDEHY